MANTVHGVGNTLSGATRSVAGAVATLSIDSTYQQERSRRLRSERAHGVGEGTVLAVKTLGQGLVDGVTGIVSQPVQGARTGGFTGFLAGIGRGITGLATKPVVGVLDGVSKLTEGLKNTGKPQDRRREPHRE